MNERYYIQTSNQSTYHRIKQFLARFKVYPVSENPNWLEMVYDLDHSLWYNVKRMNPEAHVEEY
ncbi:MAG: hypothetical protein EOO14_02060 [Chitinophagaceae bacterium]|nr:MAG: hypothetical protein EOO14_02060 [Chitinophagaceae bacterium]